MFVVFWGSGEGGPGGGEETEEGVSFLGRRKTMYIYIYIYMHEYDKIFISTDLTSN